MKLGQTVTLDYRASDAQLVFWGKLDKKAFQPSLTALGVEVGAFAWKLPAFTILQKKLYNSASFDWGSTSSAWQLARDWKQDSFQHAAVYEKLAEELGEASPLAKLIKKHLKEGAWEQELAASPPAASTAFSSFWKKQAQQLAASFQATLADVAALEENAASAGSFEEAWPEQKQQEASIEQAGRIDGSDLSLASGFGNLPLDKKLLLAEGLGSFHP